LNVSYVSMNQRLSPYYVHWVSLRAEGARPVIEMLPYGISMKSIIEGKKDSWLVALRKQINRPVVLSFGPEADGNWYQWSKNPALYRAAWRRVVHIIGHHDVTWMWQQSSRPGMSAHHLLSYWPGPRWVDWIGLDGYINRRSIDFQVRFGRAISELRRTRKRILLSEISVGQNAGRVVYDIGSVFAGIRKDHLLGLIWFDKVKLGNKLHWELENRPAALAAFRRDAARVARMK
jgi:hypothetical protein